MPRWRSIPWTAALLLATPVQGFEGRLVLQDGSPARDATVSIIGRSGATRTDAEGRFTWLPDPAPPFDLIVVLEDGRYSGPLRVEAIPDTGPLLLTIVPAGVEEVRVTAEAAPHIEAPPASAQTTLPRDEIAQRRPQNLTEALENVPGAGSLSASHSSVPSLRGLARGRTLLLLDGARVSSERRAGPSASFLDPFFLGGIEVARGPGSVAYGSDALGGIILATTPRARAGQGLAFRTALGIGFGVAERSAGVEVSHGLTDGGVLLQARWRQFPDDYRSPAGDEANSEGSDYGALARLDHEVGRGQLSVGWRSDLQRDVEEPAANTDVVRTAHPNEASHRLNASYALDPLRGGTLISLSAFAGDYELVTERERVASSSSPRAVDRSEIRATDLGLRAFASRPLRKSRLEFGLDLNGRIALDADSQVDGTDQTSIEDARRIDLGAYTTLEAPLAGLLSAAVGLRFDSVATDNDATGASSGSSQHEAVSGNLSLIAGPYRGLTITGQISRGFRDPTLSDRYFVGISGRGFVTGNPDLDPETSLQADLALRYAGERLQGACYVYSYRIEDQVERYRSGVDAEGRDLFFFRNGGTAKISGAEIELRSELPGSIRLETGAHILRGEDEDGRALADIPPRGLTVVVRRSFAARADLYARLALLARRDDPGPTEIETPGHGTVDLGGGWEIGRGVELRLAVKNLLDQEFPASPDENAPIAPGRGALVTFLWSRGQGAR